MLSGNSDLNDSSLSEFINTSDVQKIFNMGALTMDSVPNIPARIGTIGDALPSVNQSTVIHEVNQRLQPNYRIVKYADSDTEMVEAIIDKFQMPPDLIGDENQLTVELDQLMIKWGTESLSLLLKR